LQIRTGKLTIYQHKIFNNVDTVRDVVDVLERFAPPALQESYDNAGLITGNYGDKVKGILVCLDSTEEVIEEAERKGCNMVIAHHPIVFSGLKKLSGGTYVERTLLRAIRSNIAIYAAHTNLDHVPQGVNAAIAAKLGLINCRILSPAENALSKLVTFAPSAAAEEVKSALFRAGAGAIGKYDECSYSLEGTGTFRAGEDARPYVGEQGKRHYEPETRIEVVFPAHLESVLLKELLEAHPYEEVAYDIYPLRNRNAATGAGMLGELGQEMEETALLEKLKRDFNARGIRYTKLLGRKVKRVAVCGGSGSFLLKQAIRSGADVLVTADFKYHQFFDADGRILVADIGHYESEQFTKELIYDIVTKNFTKFAVHLSEVNTNPVNYF
jgi:dinuclear metal center YbgI/SA1388 family protein